MCTSASSPFHGIDAGAKFGYFGSKFADLLHKTLVTDFPCIALTIAHGSEVVTGPSQRFRYGRQCARLCVGRLGFLKQPKTGDTHAGTLSNLHLHQAEFAHTGVDGGRNRFPVLLHKASISALTSDNSSG
ncbi:hypothetical protein LX88_000590 [Lentzea californiensis]|nr:hypothetical protein [Lentzea californiensis]